MTLSKFSTYEIIKIKNNVVKSNLETNISEEHPIGLIIGTVGN